MEYSIHSLFYVLLYDTYQEVKADDQRLNLLYPSP